MCGRGPVLAATRPLVLSDNAAAVAMSETTPLRRRDVIRALAAAAAWPMVDPLGGDEWLAAWGRTVHAAGQTTPFRTLDSTAARSVDAACERIIPADDTPGARAAGVPAFIDRVLTDWCSDSERAACLATLAALDTASRAAHGVPFAEATPAQQDALLLAQDAELAAWRKMPPPAAPLPGVQALPSHGFGILKVLTIWGYYTSEVGQRDELRLFPRATTFDGCAPYAPRPRATTIADGADGEDTR